MTFARILGMRGTPHRIAQNGEILLCCLFCAERGETPDTRFRLSINLHKNYGHCYNCGWGSKGKAIQQVLWKLRMQNFIVDEMPEDEQIEEQPPFVLPEDYQAIHTPQSDLDEVALQYLIKRGVTMRQIRRKHVGVSYMGRYAYRIIFPVWKGIENVGMVTRDFTGLREPKYLNSIGEKCLYNLPVAKPKTVILCEGIFKCLRIEQVMPPDISVTATLGRDITDSQLDQLDPKETQKVVLWPDPDKPGRQGAINISGKVRERGFNFSIIWPVPKPADEMRRNQLLETWQNQQTFNWSLEQRLRIGA